MIGDTIAVASTPRTPLDEAIRQALADREALPDLSSDRRRSLRTLGERHAGNRFPR